MSKDSINMGDTVSFKVSLKIEENLKNEVRRFVLPQDCSTSLVYLKEKLRSIFAQDLGLSKFKISWRDEDGDDVTIDSDEELMIALQEMKGPVYKFDVTMVGPKIGLRDDDDNDHGPAKGEIHPGVCCDGCNGSVVGFRYKCTVCPDYDLCSKCEGSGVHPGHNMIRISAPEHAWPRNLFTRLNRLQNRAYRMEADPSLGQDWKKAKEAKEAFKEAKKEFKGSKKEVKRCHGLGAPRFGSCRGVGGHPGATSGGHDEIHANAHKDALAKMLESIVNSAQQAMDPFGVNVVVDIEESIKRTEDDMRAQKDKQSEKEGEDSGLAKVPEQSEKKDQDDQDDQDHTGGLWSTSTAEEPEQPSASASKGQGEPSTIKDQGEPSAIKDQGEPSAIKDQEELSAIKGQGEPPKVRESSEDGDWTVLDKAVPSVSYPKLDEAKLDEPIPHPNPKINVALQAMENMGFTNDGGWLTILLERFDGDIGKVLDMLQPAKPYRV